jgi:glucose/arabinose dehydrogenase
MKILFTKRSLGIVLLIVTFFSCKKEENANNDVVATGLDLQLVADNFVSPVGLVEAPDDTKNLYVVDQAGKIWIVDSTGEKMTAPFLNLSNKLVPLMGDYDERGLLGLAFHPDYATNGKFYVFYSAPPGRGGPTPDTPWDNMVRVSEFTVYASNSLFADPNSERVLLEVNHPQFNHNGGTIAFGPDKFLYISIGDGGFMDDNAPGHVEDWYKVNAGGNAQEVSANLLGKILRVDVNGDPYSVPADNPFVGKEGMDEIYAFGFRNPYRFSFDMGGNHDLIAGDAGQVLYEEIDNVVKGGNYGWNVKEGTHCFNTDDNKTERDECPAVDSAGNPLIDPVLELNNHANPAGGVGTAIVGGFVYRGTAIADLDGKYIFGVFSEDEEGTPNGKIFSATPGGSTWSYEPIQLKDKPDNLGMYLKGFGQDNSGEVYLLTSTETGPTGNSGKVMKIVQAQ